LPYLKLIGAIALIWVAIKLVAPQAHDAEDTPEAVADLWRAVRIVVIADIVMSLDNVIAVTAVAKGQYVLLTIGLAISIPIVIGGSTIILALLERFPIIVWGGAGILGWVAGNIFISDPIVVGLISNFPAERVELAAQVVGAVIVVGSGYIWRRWHHASLGEV
jgi:YjbE family integral membrane protein